MKNPAFQLLICGLLFAASTSFAFAQSQALNGQIEGTVQDQTGAAVANAFIIATNTENGASRIAQTDESGVYRFPLLPLGNYRITFEAANFKKFVREGITLAAGQTATVDVRLEAGDIKEIVTVSADTSVADAGKTDLSRVMNTREVQNLPLISRHPYNFTLLQANVTGRVSRGFAFPNFNVNGYLRRVSYLIDGNTNNPGDRATHPMMSMSDTYISEIQLVTNGLAAEFGNTSGMIMNVVTPSGTNKISGSVSYRFRRPEFYSRPFFYSSAEDIPDNKADNFTAAIGAPIIRDRWHFYAAYEWQYRDDKAAAARLLTITPANRADLIAAGLSPSIFPAAVPSLERGAFYIFRTDAQLNKSNRLTARFNHSDIVSENFLPGGLNTLERNVDAFAVNYGLAVQLASFTPQFLNELRFQYLQRTSPSNTTWRRNEFSGTGPSVNIPGVANFGSPPGITTIFPTLRITQLQDNLTHTNGKHVFKFGGGFNFYNHSDREGISAIYTFPSIAAYIAARSGSNPRSYVSYTETFGDPAINYRATFWNFFAQDDWKLTRRLKINYGLRYDLYLPPKGNGACLLTGVPMTGESRTGAQASPLAMSAQREQAFQINSSSFYPNVFTPLSATYASEDACAPVKFNVDKNNFAPRLGVVYALREGNRPTVFRFGAGIYTDAPLLAMYRRALQNNGNRKFFNFSFDGNNNGTRQPDPNAPAFPNTFSGAFPAGSTLPPQDIDAISPNFQNMYAIHSNIQIEQAITENLSLAVGFVHSGGRHIPVYRNINLINPIRFLADGRAVFSQTISAATRLDPRFNVIQMVESVGVSRYDALTLQLTKRFSRGIQFSANYTLSKATDDAPEQNMTTNAIQGLVLSDPTNRALDKGNSFADQRHTFVMSLVARPKFNFPNRTLRYLFNRNQFGIITVANSGERFNIISNLDLNGDSIRTSDRPVGIRRNAGKTPPQFNLDLRYSRFFDFTERFKLEVFGEFQNLFNTNSIVQYNNVTVATNLQTGELIGGLPDFRARNQSTAQESRQFQLGAKFIF